MPKSTPSRLYASVARVFFPVASSEAALRSKLGSQILLSSRYAPKLPSIGCVVVPSLLLVASAPPWPESSLQPHPLEVAPRSARGSPRVQYFSPLHLYGQLLLCNCYISNWPSVVRAAGPGPLLLACVPPWPESSFRSSRREGALRSRRGGARIHYISPLWLRDQSLWLCSIFPI